MGKALRSRGREETIEEEVLPDLVLRVIAGISEGIDAETAAERAFASLGQPLLRREFENGTGVVKVYAAPIVDPACGAHGRSRARGAHRVSLQDLQAEIENRWEERVQRLPVALLGPLFACFFPSALLVLAGLLLPELGSLL